jgi:MoaA/NifB/PqqE/SkfB family radical SAM enzyme
MTNLRKIISTQDPKLLDIRFWPTDICNFSCDYCFPGSVLNKLRYPKNVDTVIKNFRILFDSYVANHGKEKFKLNIVGGGEPTLWPKFKKFCRGIKLHHDVHIQCTTNASRTVRWFKDNSEDVDEFVLSYHVKDCDFENFVAVADYLYSTEKNITALILMDKTRWEQCLDVIERMKHESNYPWVIQAKEVVDAPGYDINSYTQNQLDFLHQPLKRLPESDYIIKNLEQFRIHESIAIYDEDTVIPVSSNKYIVDKENYFKGWKCHVPIENLVISHDGSIKGSCQEEIFKNANINIFSEDFEHEFRKEQLLLKPIICPRNSCSCQPDNHITKFKDAKF